MQLYIQISVCCKARPTIYYYFIQSDKSGISESDSSSSESTICDDFGGQSAFRDFVVTEGGESSDGKAVGHTKRLLDTVNNNLHSTDEQENGCRLQDNVLSLSRAH